MKSTILLIIALFLTSCTRSHSDIAHTEMISYAQKAYQERQLCLEGFGGAMMYDIQKLHLSFRSAQHLSLMEARQLLINVALEFLNHINTSQDIRPHLHDYPMTPTNIELTIAFRDQFNRRPPKPYVALASLSKGKIFYTYWDHEGIPKPDFCDDYEESFQDAVNLVSQR